MKNVRLIAARSARRPAGQRGVALYVVLIFVMLSVLLVLWASRTSLFSEMVVGNDVDYQRAFEAAQALVQDAELDVRGTNADGSECVPGGGTACRPAPAVQQIPLETQDIGPLIAQLQTATPTLCINALCAKRMGRQDFWNYTAGIAPAPPLLPSEASLAQMTIANTSGGARYGQYTGADLGSADAPINPILSNTAAGQGGWYWIEVLPYSDSSRYSRLMVPTAGQAQLLELNLSPYVVYRITALAYGRKLDTAGNPITKVVLQETYVQQRQRD